MTDKHDEHPAASVTAPRPPEEMRKATAQADLPSALTELHRHVLRTFLATGGPPGIADLRRLARGLGLSPGAAMLRLADADLVHTDPAAGAVTAAYPFSTAPTPHVVRVAGAALVYAMCAIDALGIPLMAGRDGVISSVSPVSRDPITVEYRAGTWRWQPATAAVLIVSNGAAGPSLCCTCPFNTFHATAEQAAAYLRECAAVRGWVVTQTEAAKAAQAEFGSLLTG